jgi:hypothetical protein
LSYKDWEIWQLARELVIDIHMDKLGRKLNRFINSVEKSHISER